jgi:mRNA interferase YafQ
VIILDLLTNGRLLLKFGMQSVLRQTIGGVPNWLLVWEINNQELILVLLNTGTHSDLFGKKYKKG